MDPQQNQASGASNPAPILPVSPQDITPPTPPVEPWQTGQEAPPLTDVPQIVAPVALSPEVLPPPEPLQPFGEALVADAAPILPPPPHVPVSPQTFSPNASVPTGQPQAVVSPQPGPSMQQAAPAPFPPQSPVAGPTPPAISPSQSNWQPDAQPPRRSTKKQLIALGVVVIVVAIGVAAYMMTSSKSSTTLNKNSVNKSAQNSSAQSGVPDINTLKSFTLVGPAASQLQDLSPTNTTPNHDITTLVSADSHCTFVYGNETQSELPGTDIGDILSKITASFKTEDSNMQISAPTNAAARVLKASNGKSYSLPTASFNYSDSTEKGVAATTYSASRLADGSHAVVIIACDDTDTTIATITKRVTDLEPVANAVQIKVQ